MLKESMFHLTMTKYTFDKLCASEILLSGRLKTNIITVKHYAIASVEEMLAHLSFKQSLQQYHTTQ